MRNQLFTALICLLGLSNISIASNSTYVLTIQKDLLRSHTLTGALVSEIVVDQAPLPFKEVGDLVVLDDKRIAIFNGERTAKLSVYNGGDNSWKHYTMVDWGAEGGVPGGRIAAIGDTVFVIDTFGGENGVIRFNLQTGEVTRRLKMAGAHSLAVGQDNQLYISRFAGLPPKTISKIDLDTMTIESSVRIQEYGGGDFAVDIDGNIYIIGFGRKVVKKFSPDGELLNSLEFRDQVYDLNLGMDDKIVLGGGSREVHLTDTNMSPPTSFIPDDLTFGVLTTLTSLRFKDLPHVDKDGDGVDDYLDNCAFFNPDQLDENDDGVGDLCDEDILLSLVPSLAGAINGKLIEPEWGVLNNVCCPTSSATFRMTVGQDSLSSTSQSCSAPARFSEYISTSKGTKSVLAQLTSTGRGNLPLNFSFNFEEATRYRFETRLIDRRVVVVVISEPLTGSKLKPVKKELREKTPTRIFVGDSFNWRAVE